MGRVYGRVLLGIDCPADLSQGTITLLADRVPGREETGGCRSSRASKVQSLVILIQTAQAKSKIRHCAEDAWVLWRKQALTDRKGLPQHRPGFLLTAQGQENGREVVEIPCDVGMAIGPEAPVRGQSATCDRFGIERTPHGQQGQRMAAEGRRHQRMFRAKEAFAHLLRLLKQRHGLRGTTQRRECHCVIDQSLRNSTVVPWVKTPAHRQGARNQRFRLGWSPDGVQGLRQSAQIFRNVLAIA